MPIEFSCSNCHSILKTPDESAGKAARCPNCGNVEPIPRAQQPPPVAKPVPHSYGARPQPSSDTSPYASPAYSPIPNRPVATEQSIRNKIQPPAILLLVINSIFFLSGLLGMVGGVLSLIDGNRVQEDGIELIGTAVYGLLELIGVLGAISILRMRHYTFCFAATICSIIGGFVCCMFPAGIGIWMMVVLVDPEVKKYFR